MTSERSLATRLYARMSRDPRFQKMMKDEGMSSVVVCVASDLVDDVERTLRRNYPDRRVALATYFPDRHVFEVTWMEWHDEPISEDETRPIFTRPDNQTIGEQVIHMKAVENRRYQDYLRSGGASRSIDRTYSTRELERALASA